MKGSTASPSTAESRNDADERRTATVDLHVLAETFGQAAIRELIPMMRELERDGLTELAGRVLRLTDRGRLLSNEVFERFIQPVTHA